MIGGLNYLTVPVTRSSADCDHMSQREPCTASVTDATTMLIDC